MTDLTDEQEIELEMERQDAGVEQDLHDRIADALDGAGKGAEMETIWAVIEPALATSELARLRSELANEAQRTREIESTCNRLLTSTVGLKSVIERIERLRDKWLTWPKADMHYAAGLMLDRHLSGEAFTVDTRPVSVESPGNDGFRYERPSGAPHSPAEPVSPVSTPAETPEGAGEAQEAPDGR
jgi:hypothetical protein